MYVNVPFSDVRASIDTLREILEFKVILAVIRFPGYAYHFEYRITFFSIIRTPFQNPNSRKIYERV